MLGAKAKEEVNKKFGKGIKKRLTRREENEIKTMTSSRISRFRRNVFYSSI